MRVLLISPNTERIHMPTLPLGLSLVAAAVQRARHEMQFLNLLTEPDAGAAIRHTCSQFSPQVIGISIRNIDDQNMAPPRLLVEPIREVVAACRAASEATIVLGGAGFSIFPDATLAYLGADLGVCGEGEAAFLALLARLQRGADPWGLPGVHVAGRDPPPSKTHIEDLDALALPGEDLWSSADPKDPEIWVPVQTRRGCPLDCSYCSTPDLEGRGLRSWSPQRIVEHVARVCEAGFRRFYFVDNTFNLPPSYALELSRRLAALHLGLAWHCIVYPHDVPDDLVAAMAEAGCVEVSLGFESGSPRVLRALNKQFDPGEVREISQRLAAHGIRRLGFLLLGGPGETLESAVESLEFADSLNLEMLRVNVGIRIYPRTALARLAVEEGLLSPGDDLLQPRFYIRPGLGPRIREEVIRRYGPEAIGRPIVRR